jgi:hypothetical protein
MTVTVICCECKKVVKKLHAKGEEKMHQELVGLCPECAVKEKPQTKRIEKPH